MFSSSQSKHYRLTAHNVTFGSLCHHHRHTSWSFTKDTGCCPKISYCVSELKFKHHHCLWIFVCAKVDPVVVVRVLILRVAVGASSLKFVSYSHLNGLFVNYTHLNDFKLVLSDNIGVFHCFIPTFYPGTNHSTWFFNPCVNLSTRPVAIQLDLIN